jgi:hypothetical protein
MTYEQTETKMNGLAIVKNLWLNQSDKIEILDYVIKAYVEHEPTVSEIILESYFINTNDFTGKWFNPSYDKIIAFLLIKHFCNGDMTLKEFIKKVSQ